MTAHEQGLQHQPEGVLSVEDTQPFPTVHSESTVYSHQRPGSGVFSFCFTDFPRHFFSCQRLWRYRLDWFLSLLAPQPASQGIV